MSNNGSGVEQATSKPASSQQTNNNSQAGQDEKAKVVNAGSAAPSAPVEGQPRPGRTSRTAAAHPELLGKHDTQPGPSVPFEQKDGQAAPRSGGKSPGAPGSSKPESNLASSSSQKGEKGPPTQKPKGKGKDTSSSTGSSDSNKKKKDKVLDKTAPSTPVDSKEQPTVPKKVGLGSGKVEPPERGLRFKDSRAYSPKVVDFLYSNGYRPDKPASEIRNTHDRSAAFRAALEAQAVVGITQKTIWDVGGHTTRHNLNRRSNVHCTQPRLTATDAKSGHCEHTALSCNCVDVEDLGLILAVHAAYYLSEDELWRLCLIAADADCQFKSVEHPYSLGKMCGTMDDGRFKYHYKGEQLYVAHTCDDSYDHPLPTWFLKDKIVSVRGDQAIYRNLLCYLGDTNLVSYRVAPYFDIGDDEAQLLPHRTFDYVNIIPGIYSVKYETDSQYPITDVRGGFIAIHEQTDPQWDFWNKHFLWRVPAFAALRDLLRAFGFLRFHPPQLLPVPVNQSLVHALSTQATSESTIETLDQQARSLVRANPSLVQEGDMAALSRLYAAHQAYFAYRNGILALSETSVWRSGALTSTGLGLLAWAGKLVFAIIVCACFRRRFSTRSSFLLTVLSLLAVKHFTSKWPDALRPAPPVTATTLIPASECAKSIPQLDEEKRVGCSVNQQPTLVEKRKQFFKRLCEVPANLTVQVFSTSMVNLHCSVLGRVMRKRPDPVPDLWADAMQLWDSRVLDATRDELIAAYPVPSTEAWISSRKLPSQRRLYTRAAHALQEHEGDITRVKNWAQRKIFVKREKTFVAGKLPRVIVGSVPELQVYFGPFFAAFDHRLQDALWKLGIVYCVGLTAQALSEKLTDAFCRARAHRPTDDALAGVTIFVLGDDQLIILGDGEGGIVFIENDMGAFDTTHHRHSLALRLKAYSSLGMSPKDLALWEDANGEKITMTPVVGYGKYTVDYNMCSGNPDTCSGNSTINGVTCATSVAKLRPTLCGDPAIATKELESLYTQFGFIPKTVISKDQHAVSFLSGIVLDDAAGRQVWVPKVFRMIVKLCFTIDPNINERLLRLGIRRSFNWFSFVPVFRGFLSAMPVWESDSELREVDAFIAQDRSRWYKPTSTLGDDEIVAIDVEKSFCAHYSLTSRQAMELGAYVYGLVRGHLAHDPVQDQLFRTCFNKDVGEYVE